MSEKSPMELIQSLEALKQEALANQQQSDMRRLEARAAQYALPDTDETQAEDNLTVVAFRLGAEHYALDVIRVRGVREMPPITRVPGAPPFYPGVVNVRGAIITLFDLRAFFELEAPGKPAAELIVVEVHDLQLGVMADHVMGVHTVPKTSLNPVEDAQFISGVYIQDVRWVLLDVIEIFEDDRLVVNRSEET